MHSRRKPHIAWIAVVTLAIVAAGSAAPQQGDPIQQKIQRLIQRLGDEDYFVRQQAQAELAKFSFEAFDALTAATVHEDLEIAARAKYLLQLMQEAWTVQGDPPEVQRILKDYGAQTSQTKLDRIRSLASLPERRGVPALCRLVRYEKTLLLSKFAAAELLELKPYGEPPEKELAATLRRNLSGSNRAAARWLLTWPRFGDVPRDALTEWAELIETEHALLRVSSGESSSQVVAALTRLQIEWLKKLDQKDGIVPALCRLVDVEKGNPDVLVELRDWLVKQKAWDLADEVAERFSDNPVMLYSVAQAQAEAGEQQRAEETARKALQLNPGKDTRQMQKHFAVAGNLRLRGWFDWARREYQHVIDTGATGDPIVAETVADLLDLLVLQEAWEELEQLTPQLGDRFAGHAILQYTRAQLQARQGDRQAAEETARRALQLNPGKDMANLERHYVAARSLQDRGLFAWARVEYEHTIDTGAPGNLVAAFACTGLSEMLHDREEDLEAAEVLQRLVKMLQEHPDARTLAIIKPDSIRARAEYFRACHWERQDDRARQREHLDKALQADDSEIDTLIACFRMPDAPSEYREKIRRLIARSAERFRREIAAEPNSPTAYNEFAWLVGNTEGDFDEALRYSQKSIQLKPGYGGYHDTLAHVYFAQGDYENAVKTQTKAAELEPHSGLIARQLEVFRRKWKEEEHEDPDR